jgi:glycosyltransferase involved in cell wall biosynthesis
MLKVGIQFAFLDDSWLGGVAAIANLVNALKLLDEPRVEPVLIAAPQTPDVLLKDMAGAEVLRTRLLDPSRWSSRFGRVTRRVLGSNLPLERWLRHHDIDVFSHCSPVGRRTNIPNIGHIADFGYKYFPELYSANAFKRTDAGMARLCNEHDILLLSSRAAESDYKRFFPFASAKSAVLNIVPSNIPECSATRDELANKYHLPHTYIYSPNQFWVHKNHLTIVAALAIAQSKGQHLDVVCSGQTHDPRAPHHFDTVLDLARRLGVADRFHVLGVVPYQDAMDLMRHSAVVLSASLFEGWGISVTEAKMLGKSMVLSDIPVFREQEPDRARYFDPQDAEALAAQLTAAVEEFSEREDRRAGARARARWPKLRQAYARRYEDIVLAASALRS